MLNDPIREIDSTRRKATKELDSKRRALLGQFMTPTRTAVRHSPLRLALLTLRTLALIVIGALNGFAVAAPIQPSDIHVIDGDTIRLRQQKPDVRLVGFNSPETRRAKCDAERALGKKAAGRVRDLISGGKLDFEFVACSCQPGTEGKQTCNYGRRCGTLKVNERDIGELLIAEGLAVPFKCGPTRCPPTPRPWCN